MRPSSNEAGRPYRYPAVMTGIDTAVLEWIAAHRTGWATWLSGHVLAAGTNVVLVGIGCIALLGYVAVSRRWALALTVGAAGALAATLTLVLKQLIARERPPATLALIDVGGYSMPSTDAALTAAAAVALFLAMKPVERSTRRLLVAVLASAVLFVGVCMVYLGAHWTTDVLAGWLLGTLAASACAVSVRKMLRLRACRAPWEQSVAGLSGSDNRPPA